MVACALSMMLGECVMLSVLKVRAKVSWLSGLASDHLMIHSAPHDLYHVQNRIHAHCVPGKREESPRIPGRIADTALLFHSQLDVRYDNEAQPI